MYTVLAQDILLRYVVVHVIRFLLWTFCYVTLLFMYTVLALDILLCYVVVSCNTVLALDILLMRLVARGL